MDDRGRTKASRRHEGAAKKHGERADHSRQSERLRRRQFDAATDVGQPRKRPRDPPGRRGGGSIGPAHVFDETVELFGQPNQRHLPRSPVAAHQALQNPGAVGVEFLDLAHVDFKSRRVIGTRVVYAGFEARRVIGGPSARPCDRESPLAGCANDETL